MALASQVNERAISIKTFTLINFSKIKNDISE
jgi:hypothetical protein